MRGLRISPPRLVGTSTRATVTLRMHVTQLRAEADRREVEPETRDAHAHCGLDTPLLPARPMRTGSRHGTLTLMTGADAGRVFPIGETAVLGRGDVADVAIEDAGISRRHARVSCGPSGCHTIEDLASTNGTFVGGRAISTHELRSGDHVQLGPHCLLRFLVEDDADELLQRDLFESAVHDPLTGTFNRRYFDGRLASEVARTLRDEQDESDLFLLLIDLDRFKQFNDTHGHLAGDVALRLVTTSAQRVLEGGAVLARWGGEELVVLARSSDCFAPCNTAERLRRAVERIEIPVGGATASITVSIGGAVLSEVDPADGPPALLALADERLYCAKLLGRNRVVCTTGLTHSG